MASPLPLTLRSMGAGGKSPATLTFGTGAYAQYPEKPINRIIGFNAGGGTDLAGAFWSPKCKIFWASRSSW